MKLTGLGANCFLGHQNFLLWATEQKPGASYRNGVWVWNNFVHKSRFSAKLVFTPMWYYRDLHCIILNYEASYYKLKLTGRSVKYGNVFLCTACFQFVYGCLSVHQHDKSPRFMTTVFSNCLCQLSSCFFTSTRVNLHNTIAYGDIRIYHSNIAFSQKFVLQTREPITSIFYYRGTITYRYTNFCLTFINCRGCERFSLGWSYLVVALLKAMVRKFIVKKNFSYFRGGRPVLFLN